MRKKAIKPKPQVYLPGFHLFPQEIESLSCSQLAMGSVYEFQLSYKTSTPLSQDVTESFHSELAPSWAPRRRQPPRHLCGARNRVNLSTGGWHCIMISAGETCRLREIVLNVWVVSGHVEQQGGLWWKWFFALIPINFLPLNLKRSPPSLISWGFHRWRI